jgi:hypothetical protein
LIVSNGGFGNIVDNSIFDIFNGSQRMMLQEQLTTPETSPEKCNKCIILHDMPLMLDEQMKIPADFLKDRGPTSLYYRF